MGFGLGKGPGALLPAQIILSLMSVQVARNIKFHVPSPPRTASHRPACFSKVFREQRAAEPIDWHSFHKTPKT